MAQKENNLMKKLKYRNFEMYKYFQKAIEILSVLNDKAYEAYIVGGAVRDLYLNIDFNDIDIATNATPQTIQSLFSHCEVDMQYEHLGSVVLKIDNFRYEITTFRNEEYIKHRLKTVHYSKKLVDDIQRRDFTINALAMSLNYNIIDIVKGEKDLNYKTIRIIGKGTKRFKDDPTRILRGIHLIAKLNFRIDSKTERAMIKSRKLLTELSDYKIITLLNKILNEKYSHVAVKIMKRMNLFKEMPKYNEWLKILSKVKKLNYIEEFTILFKLIGAIPINHGFSHKEIVEIKKLFELSDYISENEITPIDIIQIGIDNLLKADKIALALNKKYVSQNKKINKINKKMPIHSSRDLKISVDEIKSLLNGDNSKISMITNELLLLVVNGIINNKYSDLEEAVLLIVEGKEIKPQKQEDINPYVNQVEENERILSLLEQNKEAMSKVGEVIETKKNESVIIEKNEEIIDIDNREHKEDYLLENVNNESNKENETSNIIDNIEEPVQQENTFVNETREIDFNEQQIVEMFYSDFNELYNIYRKSVFEDIVVSSLNEEEINRQEKIIKEDVRRILIEKNPDYKYLNDRGII